MHISAYSQMALLALPPTLLKRVSEGLVLREALTFQAACKSLGRSVGEGTSRIVLAHLERFAPAALFFDGPDNRSNQAQRYIIHLGFGDRNFAMCAGHHALSPWALPRCWVPGSHVGECGGEVLVSRFEAQIIQRGFTSCIFICRGGADGRSDAHSAESMFMYRPTYVRPAARCGEVQQGKQAVRTYSDKALYEQHTLFLMAKAGLASLICDP